MMQPERHRIARHAKYSQSPEQMSFLAELFGDLPPEQSGNVISFNEIAEKHRRKMERKAYSIILNNITHLKDKNEE
jgi:hypothetical protein